MALRPSLFMFQSSTSDDIGAFALDRTGATLPKKFGPWTRTGEILPDRSPPHGLKRAAIEAGVAQSGFQLWRRKAKA
ncbi:hypothetical protein [Phreatobacter sp. AB_2022a]|uniref:hypothetical protein n=1 Tax=Phreatobacter sp. AB_2022a TaxID=3003134 RepID=UPI00056FBDF2|nr:hypothetical protein [Phreatobacter sp. AB_2022a]MCZ0737011.1 hypothetical protein [Phreatobacter sp. AB_2022a]CEJ09922.1 hypothetical protein BN1110_00193 [bacterium YEK0313]